MYIKSKIRTIYVRMIEHNIFIVYAMNSFFGIHYAYSSGEIRYDYGCSIAFSIAQFEKRRRRYRKSYQIRIAICIMHAWKKT